MACVFLFKYILVFLSLILIFWMFTLSHLWPVGIPFFWLQCSFNMTYWPLITCFPSTPTTDPGFSYRCLISDLESIIPLANASFYLWEVDWLLGILSVNELWLVLGLFSAQRICFLFLFSFFLSFLSFFFF